MGGQAERKHSIEQMREMKAVVAEGQRKMDEKKQKRERKEDENMKRLEASRKVLSQMAVQVCPHPPMPIEGAAYPLVTRSDIFRTRYEILGVEQ